MIEEYVNSFVNDLQRIDDENDGERLIEDTVSDALDEFERELRDRLERELSDFVRKECPYCDYGVCEACDGTGVIEDEGEENICNECDGSGECAHCEGSGLANNWN